MVKMSLCLMERHHDDRSETEVWLRVFSTTALDGTEQRRGTLALILRKQLSVPFHKGYGRPRVVDMRVTEETFVGLVTLHTFWCQRITALA
jgi:hypothetical protein